MDTNYAKGSDAPAAAQLGARRRGKGAGVQAQVQEMFRRAKFSGKADDKKLTASNWNDGWLEAVSEGEAVVGEAMQPSADGEAQMGAHAVKNGGAQQEGPSEIQRRTTQIDGQVVRVQEDSYSDSGRPETHWSTQKASEGNLTDAEVLPVRSNGEPGGGVEDASAPRLARTHPQPTPRTPAPSSSGSSSSAYAPPPPVTAPTPPPPPRAAPTANLPHSVSPSGNGGGGGERGWGAATMPVTAVTAAPSSALRDAATSSHEECRDERPNSPGGGVGSGLNGGQMMGVPLREEVGHLSSAPTAPQAEVDATAEELASFKQEAQSAAQQAVTMQELASKPIESVTDVVETLRRITNAQRQNFDLRVHIDEQPTLTRQEQADTQAQRFFSKAVAEVAKHIQAKRQYKSRTNGARNEELWDDYVRRLARQETIGAIVERLEREGLIPAPEPFKDPFVTAFESMAYKTPVPVAPLPTQGSRLNGVALTASAAVAATIQEVDAQTALEEEGVSGHASRSNQGAEATSTVPGTVAAMLEGIAGLDGEDEDEDSDGFMGQHNDFSEHFGSGSPTECHASASEDKEETLESLSNSDVNVSLGVQPSLSVSSPPQKSAGPHTRAQQARKQPLSSAALSQAASLAAVSAPDIRSPSLVTAQGPVPAPPAVDAGAAVAKTDPSSGDGAADEDDETLGYEIRVVYVTDTTIGLRTTWGDGYEVVEEILLATGDLAHQQETEASKPAKPVPRSEAIVGGGAVKAGGAQKRGGNVDRRVDPPSAHDMGISTGKLVRVKGSSRSRYRKLVGLVTSVVGNGKRVRVQFAGMRVTGLIQASTLELVELDGGGFEDANQGEGTSLAGDSASGSGGASSSGTSMGAVGTSSGLIGARVQLLLGARQRLVPQRSMLARRLVGWGGVGATLGYRGALCALPGEGAKEGDGDGAQLDGDSDGGPREDWGMQVSEAQRLVARDSFSGHGSLPVGYSFKRPAKGSLSNPCVQGDLEHWASELYGMSGRRFKDGP